MQPTSDAHTSREVHVEITPQNNQVKPATLLSEPAGLTAAAIKDAMSKGAVWLTRGRNTRRLRRQKSGLRPGDQLHIYYDPKVLAEAPPEPRLMADEGDYSVWCKPYGMRSQGSRWGDHTTLERWAELHLKPRRPAFTVHRLDRAATGLMLLAHGKSAAAALAALFRDRAIDKRYRAVVKGLLPGGQTELRIDQPIDHKPALSHVRLLDTRSGPERSLLEIRIETGRKHQIRRHLAGIGLPIVGDRLYGDDRGEDRDDLMLTAVSLRFVCPVSGCERCYELPADRMPRL